MQEDLNLGDIVINKAAVRMDGASKAYAPIEYPAAADMRVTLALEEAARTLKIPFKTGISVSTRSYNATVLTVFKITSSHHLVLSYICHQYSLVVRSLTYRTHHFTRIR